MPGESSSAGSLEPATDKTLYGVTRTPRSPGALMRHSAVPVPLDSSSTNEPGAPRFGEFSKLLPVGVVIFTIIFLYVEYVFLHCLRLLQWDLPLEARLSEESIRGAWQLIVFHLDTALLLYCLGRCLLTDPGSIPDGVGWELRGEGESLDEGRGSRRLDLNEKKTSGERRHCKWCLKYKPDRCHHCRICNMCVLRMDHHCPWIYNCIGFKNHKYFLLILIYAVLDLAFISITMFESVWWSTRTDVSISMMLTLSCGETFATFLFVVTGTFLGFHFWLMRKAMTTLEFCEKSAKKSSYNTSIYSQGLFQNICSVLGPNPLLWFVPIGLPEGDGMSWPTHSS